MAASFELVGIVTGGRMDVAIIKEDARGAQQAYRIGDSVRDGLVLKEILREGVNLAAGEVSEHLPLKARVTIATAAIEVVRPAAVPRDSVVAATKAAARARLHSGAEMLAQDLFTPYAGGGFQLAHVKPGSPHARWGLRAGDVLRSINGAPVYLPDQLGVLHQHPSEGASAEIQVLREGRLETLHIGGS